MDKKKKIILIVVGILSVIIIFIISFLITKTVIKKEEKDNANINIVEKVDRDIQEETKSEDLTKKQDIVITSKIGMKINDKVSFSNIYSTSIYDQIVSGGITEEYKIIKSIDQVLKDVSYSYMLETPDEYAGNNISSANLEKVSRDIFGKNISLKHKSVYLTKYDDVSKYYTITPIGFAGGDFEYVIQVPYKIEENDFECYLYSYEIFAYRRIKNEDVSQDMQTNIYYDKERLNIITEVMDEKINNEEYQADVINALINSNVIDRSKLVKLKYTLKKENNDYYLFKIDKI